MLSALSSRHGALARARRTGRTLPLTVALGAGLVVALAQDRAWAL